MLVLPFGNFFKSKFTRPMLPFLRNSVTGSHRPTNCVLQHAIAVSPTRWGRPAVVQQSARATPQGG